MEVIRLFPPDDIRVRIAMEDVSIKVPSRIPNEKDVEMVIKKGTLAVVDVVGISTSRFFHASYEISTPSM